MIERDRHQHKSERLEHISADEGRINTTECIHRACLFSDYAPTHRHVRPPHPPGLAAGQDGRNYR